MIGAMRGKGELLLPPRPTQAGRRYECSRSKQQRNAPRRSNNNRRRSPRSIPNQRRRPPIALPSCLCVHWLGPPLLCGWGVCVGVEGPGPAWKKRTNAPCCCCSVGRGVGDDDAARQPTRSARRSGQLRECMWGFRGRVLLLALARKQCGIALDALNPDRSIGWSGGFCCWGGAKGVCACPRSLSVVRREGGESSSSRHACPSPCDAWICVCGL